MPNPKVVIELTAQSTGYTKATEEVRQATKRMATQMKEHSLEARHGLHLVTEELGIHMPRVLQGFVAKLPGVTTAMSAAFNAVAIFALIAVVVEVTKKVYEFAETTLEAGAKNREAWETVNLSLESTSDSLQLANDKLANSIAKFEGKPQNGLKMAIDEAIESANKLGSSLNTDLSKLADVQQKQQIGMWSFSHLYNSRTTDIAGQITYLQSQLRDIDKAEHDKLAGMRSGGASASEISTTENNFDIQKKQAIADRKKWMTDQIASAKADNGGSQRIDQLKGASYALTNVGDILDESIEHRNLERENEADEAKKKHATELAEAARKAKEAADKRARELSSIIAGTISDGQLATHGDDRVTEALKEGYHEYTQQRLEEDKRVADAEKVLAKEYIKDVHDQIQEQRDLISVAQKQMQGDEHSISRREKNGDMSPRAAYEARRESIISADSATHDALTTQQQLWASLGNTAEADKVGRQIEEAERESGQRLVDLHEQYSDQIQQRWMQALDGINSQIATWVTGGKTNWSGMAKGEAGKLTQGALRTGEHALMSSLGIGGKADGSKSNPIYTRDADGKIIPGMDKSLGGGLFGGLLGKLNDSNKLGSMFGGKLFGSGSLLGHALGGFALGGDVLQSGVYNTGEQGPEQVYLPRGSHVVPHSAGGSPTYVIDARGTDAALVAAHTEAAMRQTHSQAVHDAGRAMAERQRRVPQG